MRRLAGVPVVQRLGLPAVLDGVEGAVRVLGEDIVLGEDVTEQARSKGSTCSACGAARDALHSVIERQAREIVELRRLCRGVCIARDCRRRVRVEVDE